MVTGSANGIKEESDRRKKAGKGVNHYAAVRSVLLAAATGMAHQPSSHPLAHVFVHQVGAMASPSDQGSDWMTEVCAVVVNENHWDCFHFSETQFFIRSLATPRTRYSSFL